MKRLYTVVIIILAAAGVAFSQSTSLKLPTSTSTSSFSISNSNAKTVMEATGSGRVGIATSTPSQALEVNGKIVSDSGYVFPDGTTQTTAATSSASEYGYVYDLSGSGQTVAGGVDVSFSNNGPLNGVTHTAGTTTVTVPTAGVYKIEFTVSYTAGVGSALAIAVNGTVDASTVQTVLTATGQVTGTSMLTLAAGDVITLRNNSATPFTTDTAPGIGASLTITSLP